MNFNGKKQGFLYVKKYYREQGSSFNPDLLPAEQFRAHSGFPQEHMGVNNINQNRVSSGNNTSV